MHPATARRPSGLARHGLKQNLLGVHLNRCSLDMRMPFNGSRSQRGRGLTCVPSRSLAPSAVATKDAHNADEVTNLAADSSFQGSPGKLTFSIWE